MTLLAPTTRGALIAAALLGRAGAVGAACTGCAGFEAGVALGSVSFNALTEASGLAASRRNYTVLWTHNDGSAGKVYALTTNGTRLATFDLTKNGLQWVELVPHRRHVPGHQRRHRPLHSAAHPRQPLLSRRGRIGRAMRARRGWFCLPRVRTPALRNRS